MKERLLQRLAWWALIRLTYGVWKRRRQAHARPPPPLAPSLDALVGRTPLIELRALSRATGCRILAKCEFLNPGGSVKDRIAVALVDALEASGALRPGGTIVEATGGNTGIGLALVARSRGYGLTVTLPDCISREKIELLETLGATVRPRSSATCALVEHFYRRPLGLSTPSFATFLHPFCSLRHWALTTCWASLTPPLTPPFSHPRWWPCRLWPFLTNNTT